VDDGESKLPWFLLGAGALVGSWMNLSVALAFLRDPSHPTIGWGVVGLIFIQPVALMLAGAGGLGVLSALRVGGREVAIVLAVLAYVGFAFLGFLYDNSGC
jgi:hypothetical protein